MKKDIITIEKIGEVIELGGKQYKSANPLDTRDRCEGCAFRKTHSDGRVGCAGGGVKCFYDSFGYVIFKEVSADVQGNNPMSEKDVKDIAALMNERDFAKHSIELLQKFRKISKVTISTKVYTGMIELT